MRYLCLLRGVNVGGNNKVSMTELRTALESAGFNNVSTYINSGNVLFDTDLQPEKVRQLIEDLLSTKFKLDSNLNKVCLLTKEKLEEIVTRAPKDFGSKPEIYYSDVLFPIDISSADIMRITEKHPDVDEAWESNGVVYYQRVGALRTKSRLSKIIAKPEYKSITIRSWNTTVKLLNLLTTSD